MKDWYCLFFAIAPKDEPKLVKYVQESHGAARYGKCGNRCMFIAFETLGLLYAFLNSNPKMFNKRDLKIVEAPLSAKFIL